jgi:hypothetical protein
MNGRLQGIAGNDDVLFEPHDVFPCSGLDEWPALAITDVTTGIGS